MVWRWTYLALALLSQAACTLQPAREGRALGGAEIERLFEGRSFTLVGMKSGNVLRAYADGEYCTLRYVDGERTKRVRWFVRGGRHCCINKGEEVCGRIYDMGNGVYHKVSDGRHSHTLKGFAPGNRL